MPGVEIDIPPEDAPTPLPSDTPPDPPSPIKPVEEPQPEVTTAAAWKRTTTGRYLVSLPSGAIVKARKVDGAELLMEGLLDIEQLQGVGAALHSPEKLRAQVDAARHCATRIVVSPPVVVVNGNTQGLTGDVMAADAIPGMDAVLLLTWALGFSRAGLVQAIELPSED